MEGQARIGPPVSWRLYLTSVAWSVGRFQNRPLIAMGQRMGILVI